MVENGYESVFIIDFNNEATDAYQFHSYWDGQTIVNSQKVGGVHTPLASFWSTLGPTQTWIDDYNDFVAAYNTLDYFGGLLYPVADNGNATHLHMFAAIEGGATINKTEFSTALGNNWPGKSDTTHASSGTQPLSTPTSFITTDSRGAKVFANATDVNNPYTGTTDYSLVNYNYNGVYNKKEVSGELDFNSVDLGNDINNILQPVVQDSTANVVKHFDQQTGELFIKGFISQTVEFTEDGDCIRMEVADDGTTGGHILNQDLTIENGDKTHALLDKKVTFNSNDSTPLITLDGGQDLVKIDGEIQITSGAATDYVLTSDANGKGTWTDIDTLVTLTQGATGPQGPTGATGPQGPAGPSTDTNIFNTDLDLDGDTREHELNDGVVHFKNGGEDVLSISGEQGGIGIGTTEPDSKLHVEGPSGTQVKYKFGSARMIFTGTETSGWESRFDMTSSGLEINSNSSARPIRITGQRDYLPVLEVENYSTSGSYIAGDGIKIQLNASTIPSPNEQGNPSPNNARFIDFWRKAGSSGSNSNLGYIGTLYNGTGIGLANLSDGRLKDNQRQIEYSLDDISDLKLRTFDWLKPWTTYELIEEIDLSDNDITFSVGEIIISINESADNYVNEFNDKYLKVGEEYIKVNSEFNSENNTTKITFADSSIEYEAENNIISTYSIKSELVSTGNVGHGIVAQDLLELPKFKNMVDDNSNRNKANGLVEGDPGYEYMAVDYVQFMPVILAGLQDAHQMIKELKQEVNNLKQQSNNQNNQGHGDL